jgi:hypothetical protein
MPKIISWHKKMRVFALFFYFLALALLLRWHALSEFTTHYIGGTHGDPGLYVWLSQIGLASLDPQKWFTTPAFYPYGSSLAWSDNFLLPTFCILTLQFLGANHTVAYNSTLLLAVLLNGLFTFYLARTLSLRTLGALLAGTAFASFSFITEHTGHPQLQFTFWLPLILSRFILCMRDPSKKKGFLLGAFIGGAFLTTVYYALFAISLMIIMGVAVVVCDYKKINFKKLATCFVSSLVGLIPFLPFIFPYLQVQKAFGARGLYQAFYFSTDLFSYISAGEHNLFYGFTHNLSHTEAHLFGGVAILLLLVAGSIKYVKRAGTIGFFSLLALLLAHGMAVRSLPAEKIVKTVSSLSCWVSIILAFVALWKSRHPSQKKELSFTTIFPENTLWFSLTVILVLSLGPLGNDAQGDLVFSPYVLWHYAVPGFGGIRAIGRLGIAGFLLIALVCGKVAEEFLDGKKLLVKVSATAFLFGFIITENYNAIFPISPSVTPPSVLTTLDSLPPGELLYLPFTENLTEEGNIEHWSNFAELNVHYMNWSSKSGRSIVNGYSGLRSHFMKNYPRWMSSFPSDQSIRAARRIAGLRYIVVLPHLQKNFKREQFLSQLENFSSDLKLIKEDNEGNYLLELIAQSNFIFSNELIYYFSPYRKTLIKICGKNLISSDVMLYEKQGKEFTKLIPVQSNKCIETSSERPEIRVSPHQINVTVQEEAVSKVDSIKLIIDDKTLTLFESKG